MNHIVDISRDDDRDWTSEAVRAVEADAARSADTHLHVVPLPPQSGIDLYLKDEAGHPTGSLKHRLARSLVLYGLCNGWIRRDTTLVDASSGSTAVSEAYFARLLGLPFVAVVPRTTSRDKLALIESFGGRCAYVEDPSEACEEAARIATECGGHYLDQFTYAERATDWRGNNNIAESIFEQLRLERHREPAWVVVGAGTGGTSATIGRFVRYRRLRTRVAVVDPEGSAFLRGWVGRDPEAVGCGSRIEGIGRPRVELSFVPTVVDRMLHVPDAASVAGMHWLHEVTGQRVGPSTGTAAVGALRIAEGMAERGEGGAIVMLLCDRADRYTGTFWDGAWLASQQLDPVPWRCEISSILEKLSSVALPAPPSRDARDGRASG